MKNYKGIEEFYNTYIELEQIKRTGWLMCNVPAERIESVSDHTLQVVMLATTLCYELKLEFDICKLVQMCFIHDIGETLIGDISDVDKDHADKKKLEKEAVIKILSTLSKEISEKYLSLWLEVEEQKSPIAQFVFQVDKIDAVMKAKKYSKDYNMPALFNEFYETRIIKGTFNEGILKEMFENLKEE